MNFCHLINILLEAGLSTANPFERFHIATYSLMSGLWWSNYLHALFYWYRLYQGFRVRSKSECLTTNYLFQGKHFYFWFFCLFCLKTIKKEIRNALKKIS